MALVIMSMNNIKIHNKFKYIMNKIISSEGFSLTETISTLVVMSLVGIMITTGITTSARVYKQITEHTNAQLMLTNTITALHDELIYAMPDDPKPIITGNKQIRFKHVQNNIETIRFNDTEGNKGIYIGYGDTPEYSPIVPYQNSTSLYNEWEIISDEDRYLIKVWICRSDGTLLISPVTYEVQPLN